MNDLDDLDFLLDQPGAGGEAASIAAWGPQAAADVEAVRGPMLDWAAQTLAVRHPDVVRFRANKGVMACRQDLDIHLKHLHGALRGLGAADLVQYRQQLPQLWQERGADHRQIGPGLQVLVEALWRFVPPPHGGQVAALFVQAGLL
jgi:hypothetical protein